MTEVDALAERLMAAGSVDADAVLALRRRVWPDGRIEPAEAEMLFAINDRIAAPPREWVDFFVEALTDHCVRQQPPTGYVSEAQGEWLIARIQRDGAVESLGELELLVKLHETATATPPALKRFALAAIERIVVDGTGPTRSGGAHRPGSICAAEAALLRRLLFAQGGDGPAHVSAEEAAMLFRIKDAVQSGDNAPEWETLFVQAVGNHLMAYASYAPLGHAEAARMEAFMADTRVRIGRFLGTMARSVGREPPAARAVADRAEHARVVDAARAVTPAEAEWLRARIDADGAFDPLERALLRFVAEESGQRIGPG